MLGVAYAFEGQLSYAIKRSERGFVMMLSYRVQVEAADQTQHNENEY